MRFKYNNNTEISVRDSVIDGVWIYGNPIRKIRVLAVNLRTSEEVLRAVNYAITWLKCGTCNVLYKRMLTNTYREVREHEDIISHLIQEKRVNI